MAFCSYCGKKLNEGAKFCSGCGRPVQEQTSDAAVENNVINQAVPQEQKFENGTQQTTQQGTYVPPAGSGFSSKTAQFTKMDDKTAEFDTKDISENKVYGVLSYLSFLVLVPIIAAPGSKFAKFHANQGLVLLIAEAAGVIIRFIISAVIGVIIRTIAFNLYNMYFLISVLNVFSVIINIIFTLFFIALGVLSIIGIIDAAQGKARNLPLISKFKILK